MAFRSFVVLGAMRTGSNLLEQNLNAAPGITCHGELFNPAFVGYPKGDPPFGLTRDARDDDPLAVLTRLHSAPGLNGFRFFPDHDPRVLEAVLEDRSCAKIILSRNPVESFVSLAIARKTDQWKLGDVRNRRSARVRFDEAEFGQYLDHLAEFRRHVRTVLQSTGQAPFQLDYADLRTPAALGGLFRFLGVDADMPSLERPLVPQNPEPLGEKVTNPREMAAALARTDPFGLTHLPDFELRRGPAVPSFVASDAARALFMPVAGGPSEQIESWLQSFGALQRDFGQASLKDWMRKMGAHRRFTVLRHPLLRAYAAYEWLMLAENAPDLRDQIARRYKIATAADDASRRAGFAAFLRFVKANLNGQTALRTHAMWASQSAVLQGFQSFAPPDLIAREDRLQSDLDGLCATLDLHCPTLPTAQDGIADRLAVIHEADLEKLARQVYARDYLNFGFGDWRGA
ncbi:MAG TPA: nodulation protein NodH [Paracoccaceae bacterium]|nr:nodulation protein NodH [Paracoccaceae bacterium]